MNNLGKRDSAELLGTAMIVFMSYLAGAKLGGMVPAEIAAAVMVIPFAFAYVIFHKISGGHFNPGVSIGMWLAGRMQQGEAMRYATMQIIGAVVGFVLVYVVQIGLSDFKEFGLPEQAWGVGAGYLGILIVNMIMMAAFVLIYFSFEKFETLWFRVLLLVAGFGLFGALSYGGINIAKMVIDFLTSLSTDAGNAIVGFLIILIGNIGGAVIAAMIWKMATGEGQDLSKIADQVKSGDIDFGDSADTADTGDAGHGAGE